MGGAFQDCIKLYLIGGQDGWRTTKKRAVFGRDPIISPEAPAEALAHQGIQKAA